MRITLCGFVLLACCGLGGAGAAAAARGRAVPTPDSGAPPPAPPARAVRGPLLLMDDFGDASLGRWKVDRQGVWSVRRGMLLGELPDERQQHSLIECGSDDWGDIALDVDVCQTLGVDKGAVVRVGKGHGVGVDMRGPGYNDVLLNRGEWPIGRGKAALPNGVWHHLRIEAVGHRYRVFVDDALVIDRIDLSRSHPRGHIGLAAYTGGVGQCRVWYDHLRVTALGDGAAARPAPSAIRRAAPRR